MSVFLPTAFLRRFAVWPAVWIALLCVTMPGPGLRADVPVNMDNKVLDNRLVFFPDGSKLVGTQYRAQLYLVTGTTYTEVGPPMRFRTESTSSPGTWSGKSVTLPGVAERQTVKLAVGVWDDSRFATFEDAIVGRSFAGRTAPFNYAYAPSEPPSVPDSWMKNFPGLTLTDYALVPPTLDPPSLTDVPELAASHGQLSASFGGRPAPGTVFELVSGPAGFVLGANGAWAWTPTEANGPGVFTVRVVVRAATNPAVFQNGEFQVTVSEVNTAPVLAVGDRASADLEPQSFVLAGSDADQPAQALTYSLVSGPLGLSVAADGTVTWLPVQAPGPGAYAAVVQVHDGFVGTEAGFTLRVEGTPVNFANQVLEDRPVLGPDGQPLVGPQFRAQLYRVTGATYTEIGVPLHFRTVTTQLPGTWIGRMVTLPGVAEGEVVQLAVGVWDDTRFASYEDAVFGRGVAGRTAPFNYAYAPSEPPSVGDPWIKNFPGLSLIDFALVPPALDPPVISALPELVPAQGQLSASFLGRSAPDTVFELLEGPTGFVVNAGGSWSWTPAETAGPGVFQVRVVTRDGSRPLVARNDEFHVNVTEVNEPPVLAAVADPSVAEGSALALTLAANDPDEPKQALTFSLVSGPTGLTVSGAGQVAWTPTEAQGPSNPEVTVAVSDGVVSVTRTFHVNVTEVNEPPVLAALADQTVAEGSALALTLAANDPDEPKQTLTFSLVSGPTGLTVSGAGQVAWTPTEAQGPSNPEVTVTVSDGVVSVTRTFHVNVTEVNEPPVLAAVADPSVAEGSALALTLAASDGDEPKQALTFSLVSGPAGLTVSGAGQVAWTPTEAQGPSNPEVTVAVSDGVVSVTRTFHVNVTEVNEPPVLAAVADKTLEAGATLALTLAATDSDLPAQTLSFALVSGPTGLAVSSSGAVAWSPADAQRPSTNTVNVTVTDGTWVIAGSFVVIAAEPPADLVSLAGLAVDGYIARGTVFFDANRNGVPDGSEPVTQSDAQGRFDLKVDLKVFDTNHNGKLDPAEGRLVISGGVDLATGLPLGIPLTAPPGAEVISPLTTLVEAMVRPGGFATVAAAEAAISTSLNLPAGVSLTTFDPVAEVASGQDVRATEVLRAAAQVQDTVVQLTAVLNSEGHDSGNDSAVIDALAGQMSRGTAINLNESGHVASVLADAAKGAGVTVTKEVGAAAAFVVSSLNEAKEAAISGADSGLDTLVAISRIQTQAQGSTADALGAAARGEVAGDEVIAANSGAALSEALAAVPVGNMLGETTPPGEFEFSNATFTVAENGRSATPVTLARHGGSGGAVNVQVLLVKGTAKPGRDYLNNPIRLTFADGELVKALDLSKVIKDDDKPEGTETLTLQLALAPGAPAGAKLGATASAVLSIQDNDVAGTFEFASARFEIREDGQKIVPVVIRRSDGLDGDVRVRITPRAIAGGALPSADFAPAPVDVTLPSGVSQRIVNIVVVDDDVAELDEALALDLTLVNPPEGARLGSLATAQLIIRDNDVLAEPARVAARPESLNGLRLEVRGSAGMRYRLEGSANLRDWELVRSLTLPTDAQPAAVSLTPGQAESRFFRAVPVNVR